MNPLRSLWPLVRRVLVAAGLAASVLIWALGLMLEVVLGRFEWHAPAWMQPIGAGMCSAWRWIRGRPVLKTLGALAVGTVAVIGGKVWYDSRPRPAQQPVPGSDCSQALGLGTCALFERVSMNYPG